MAYMSCSGPSQCESRSFQRAASQSMNRAASSVKPIRRKA